MRIDRRLDSFLTFQVKRAGGSSNKALRLNHNRLRAGAAYAGLYRGARHPISLSNDDYPLSGKIHVTLSLLRTMPSKRSHHHTPLRAVYYAPGLASKMNDSPSDMCVMRPRNRLPFARNIEYW